MGECTIGRQTYQERSILHGVPVIVTERCKPVGFYQAAPVGTVGVVYALWEDKAELRGVTMPEKARPHTALLGA